MFETFFFLIDVENNNKSDLTNYYRINRSIIGRRKTFHAATASAFYTQRSEKNVANVAKFLIITTKNVLAIFCIFTLRKKIEKRSRLNSFNQLLFL